LAERQAPGAVECNTIQDLDQHDLCTELVGDTGEPISSSPMVAERTLDPNSDHGKSDNRSMPLMAWAAFGRSG
jgi:hypothetical protein